MQSLLVYVYKKKPSQLLVVLYLCLEASFCAEGLLRLGALKSVNFLILLQSLV